MAVKTSSVKSKMIGDARTALEDAAGSNQILSKAEAKKLPKELDQLRKEHAWVDGGHSAKTLVKHPDMRVVLIALKRGASMGEHKTIGRVSVQTLEGRVQLKLPGEVVDLPKGGLLALEPSIPHDVEALEESVLLLTIAWPTAAKA